MIGRVTIIKNEEILDEFQLISKENGSWKYISAFQEYYWIFKLLKGSTFIGRIRIISIYRI